jgi:malonyl-CoA O-methyltransferase
LHWSKPQVVIDAIARFAKEKILSVAELGETSLNETPLDKKKVARSFSRAAATYDSVAQLQRDIGAQLFTQLPGELTAQSVVLDLGSGTGFFTRQLAVKYPESQVVGLDIAEGMLHYAAQQQKEITWLCSDAELLIVSISFFPVSRSSGVTICRN